MKRPLYFIGGNNEDFEALHDCARRVRAGAQRALPGAGGVRQLHGLRVAFLSGIHAPRFYRAAAQAARRRCDTAKQAGYFRRPRWSASGAWGAWT